MPALLLQTRAIPLDRLLLESDSPDGVLELPPAWLAALPGLAALPQQLQDAGLRQINTEVVQAAKSRDLEGSGSRHFSETMAAFHAGAAAEFRELEVGLRLPPLLLPPPLLLLLLLLHCVVQCW